MAKSKPQSHKAYGKKPVAQSRFFEKNAMDLDIITDPQKILDTVNYPFFFSNMAVHGVLPSFPARYLMGDADSKKAVFEEAEMTIFVYMMLIYKIYPKYEKFRKAIEGSQELSSNFLMVRQWLDSSNAEKMLDQVLEEIGAGKGS